MRIAARMVIPLSRAKTCNFWYMTKLNVQFILFIRLRVRLMPPFCPSNITIQVICYQIKIILRG